MEETGVGEWMARVCGWRSGSFNVCAGRNNASCGLRICTTDDGEDGMIAMGSCLWLMDKQQAARQVEKYTAQTIGDVQTCCLQMQTTIKSRSQDEPHNWC